MGVSEIAALAGVTRQAVVNWRARYRDFPKPRTELQTGPVWDSITIRNWLKRKDAFMTQVAERQIGNEVLLTREEVRSDSDDNVAIAFDLLSEELEDAIDAIGNEGAQAFQRGDYTTATELAEKAQQATAFRHRMKEIERDWQKFRSGRVVRTLKALHQKRILPGRVRKGQRTPEEKYQIPLLESLIELGGRGQVSIVLDRIGKKLADVFNDYDLAPVPSNPSEVRWRNAAKWCRNTLVNEGLLAADSQHGIWEITDAGRKAVTDAGAK